MLEPLQRTRLALSQEPLAYPELTLEELNSLLPFTSFPFNLQEGSPAVTAVFWFKPPGTVGFTLVWFVRGWTVFGSGECSWRPNGRQLLLTTPTEVGACFLHPWQRKLSVLSHDHNKPVEAKRTAAQIASFCSVRGWLTKSRSCDKSFFQQASTSIPALILIALLCSSACQGWAAPNPASLDEQQIQISSRQRPVNCGKWEQRG